MRARCARIAPVNRTLGRAVAIALLATAIAACNSSRTRSAAPILLFTGTGTSPGDVAAIETVLSANHFDYATASSATLNAMADDEIRRYRLLILPGGNFVDMGNSITPVATARIRDGVQHGLNYLGVCAGAFLAGSFPPPDNSLNLTSGVQFGFYAAVKSVNKTAVRIALPDGATVDHYWEDGPQLTGWGEVIAKYPDGTPAIVQGTFGNGWVVLTGIHPEAPESWRRGMVFNTPSSTDNAFAATLIRSALNRTALSHF